MATVTDSVCDFASRTRTAFKSDSRYALASKLAQFLRRNGDKVIDGSSKLSLTTSALCLLNSLFTDISNSNFSIQALYVITQQNEYDAYQIYDDIKYLSDFMKSTPSLKLFHETQTLRGGIDLSHFSNLTVLELRKIPAHLIIGLNSLSIQLKAFICSRSIYLLKELFGAASDEQSISDVWTELKELNLSYNYIENLDDSIKSLPNIEILDLSHNNLRNTDGIQVLKRLKFVNLSYNQLETLPTFSSLSCRFLNKLYVRNNNLEKLEGLECLFNLEEFDVGYNLLSEYSVLSPLDKLKSLKMLNLEGNPLFFHKHHLKLVCYFLHPCALNSGLRLNGILILIPQNMNRTDADTDDTSRHQTSINTLVGDIQDVRPSEVQANFVNKFSPLTSVVSASSYTSQSDIEQLIEKKPPKNKRRKSKSKKMKEALISEPVDVDCATISASQHNEDIPSHIKTKQVFEARREKLGESWLIPDNPFQQSIPKVPANTPVISNVLTESPPKELPLKLQACLESQTLENLSTLPLEKEKAEVLDIHKETTSDVESERKRHISKESDDIEVLSSNLQGSADDTGIEMRSSEDVSDCDDFYDSCNLTCSANEIPEEIDAESEEESEDSIFFVEKVTELNRQMVSVNIGPKYANEKDALTAKLLDKLDLSSLSSVNTVVQEKEGVKVYELHLEFDSAKTSRQKRLYEFQDIETVQRMSKLLQPYADASTLKEATIGALECLNCKSQFSRQVAHLKVLKTKKPGRDMVSSSYDSTKEYPQEADACPNCGNHILVELETIPLPSIATPPRLMENRINIPKKSPQTTPETMSVGSASSGNFFANLFSSIKISPMTKRKSIAVPLNDSIGGDSLKSGDTIGADENDKEFSSRRASEPRIRRTSSDITIISNPSQSSIAVIPDPALENNLNTILERDSQASLSPPISGRSTISTPYGYKDIVAPGEPDENAAIQPPVDQDFYSFESIEGVSEKPFKCNDIVSNDSEIFHSPYKSAGSSSIDVDESTRLMQILGDKKIVTSDFMELDHRLKLHIEINIFGNDEHLTACLQTSIVPLYSGEEYDGVFVLSTKNVYIIKFLALYHQALEQSESLEKQVQVLFNGPISNMKQIRSLMGNQGISVACGPATHIYSLFIRDADTCNSFLNLISEQVIEKNPHLEILSKTEQTLSIIYESVLKSSNTTDGPQILLHQFASQKDKDIEYPVCIILTEEDIILSRILYKKQQSCTDLATLHPYCYTNSDHQKVSDVISLKLVQDLTCVEICFLIESSDVESMSWTVAMQTKSAMFSFISALKSPWEDLFGVPLPLSMVDMSS